MKITAIITQLIIVVIANALLAFNAVTFGECLIMQLVGFAIALTLINTKPITK